MKKSLFWSSLVCSILTGIFLFSPVSLYGYKTDFYFFLFTLVLNISSFFLLRTCMQTRQRSLFNFFAGVLQVIGLCIFFATDTLQADRVYQPKNNKYNILYPLTGWYKLSYFKPHQAELCGDGELWETEVPNFLPIIEIERSRDECHRVSDDPVYKQLYHHVPE